jgi:hypothetical protein
MRHFIVAREHVHEFFLTRAEVVKKQSDRGDGMTSFLATVIFVAAVAIALFSTHLPTTIATKINTSITSIIKGDGGQTTAVKVPAPLGPPVPTVP